MKKVLLLFVAVFLTGCANKVWTHSSKRQQEFYRDSSRCEAMSNSAGSGQMIPGGNAFADGYNQGTAISAAGSRNRIFSNCMMGEGWYLVTEKDVTPIKKTRKEPDNYVELPPN